MKVIEDVCDRNGIPCLIFNTTDLKKIHDWLWSHYNRYKFIVILDESKDEYEAFGYQTFVYFGDVALDEIAEYYDRKVVAKKRVEEYGGTKNE